MAHDPSARVPTSSEPAAVAPGPLRARVHALDWLRGLVMVLMAVDHADARFAASHLMTDTAWLYDGSPLPAGPFLTRWLTHLCAPTFLFLMGAGVALSSARAVRSAGGHDRHLLVRGGLLMALDPLWMWWAFGEGGAGVQVLFVLGASLVCLAPLRRLSSGVLLALALAWGVAGEALTGLAVWLDGTRGQGMPSPIVAFLCTGGRAAGVFVVYPLLPWLALAVLGLVFGRALATRGPAWAARALVTWGVGALVVFAVVRGLNGYGNMQLLRTDASALQWLHVSKYPPSLSFFTLELGLMALVLAGFLAGRRWFAFGLRHPLTVFGQCALPFYLVHVHVLWGMSAIAGFARDGHLAHSWLFALLLLALLYPFCRFVRWAKLRYPRGPLRLL